LDSELTPGRAARRTRTHERSSGAEMHDRIGHGHVPMKSSWAIRELSVSLSVKPSTLYAWAGQERIPCLTIHGLVRFRREEAYGAWETRCSQRGGADDEPTENDLDEGRTDFGKPELARDWNRVIEGLRWLTAYTRPTQ
jgi:hypothetical protein